MPQRNSTAVPSPGRFSLLSAALALGLCATATAQADPWVVYEGGEGPGKGKHIVFVTGDEEYRSEEACPMLAKILAVRHGFRCTVLFAINAKDGTIDPTNQTHIPGLDRLATADLMVVFLRFRELPDADMKHFDEFVHSGKPMIGLRTATHAFNYKRNKKSPYAHYHFGFRGKEWPRGFGRQVLGETWISHHGHHKRESTRGVMNAAHGDHPILRGVTDVWGPTDVYGVTKLVDEAVVLVHGQVLAGMKPTDPPVEGKKNEPMMPLLWTKGFKGRSGKTSRVMCTTMGAATDFESEGLRRLLVNACYWGLRMEDAMPKQSDVAYVDAFDPTDYGFGKARKGVKPEDHALRRQGGGKQGKR